MRKYGGEEKKMATNNKKKSAKFKNKKNKTANKRERKKIGNCLVEFTEAWKLEIEHHWNGVEEKKKNNIF